MNDYLLDLVIFAVVAWIVTWPFRVAYHAWKLRKLTKQLERLQSGN